jgi:hypothetical protein
MMDWTVFQAGIDAEAEGYSAVVIDTVSDSGLRALRSRLSIPVVGPGECAFHAAMMLGKKFTVLTMWPEWFPLYQKTLTEYGFWDRVASLRSINTLPDVTELLAGNEEVIFDKLKAEATRAMEEDGADVIVLGSTTMHQSAAFLAALPYVTAPPEAIAAALERLMPRAPVIVIELAGLAFALFAFGHRRGPKVRSNGSAAAPAGRSEASEADMGIPMSDRPAKRTETRTQAQRPDGPKVRKQATGRSGSTGQRRGPSGGQSATTREQAEADLLTLLALGQSVPSQRTLAERWDRPKQTVSDWLTTWEADGLIPSRRQVGREKMLAGQAKARAVA